MYQIFVLRYVEIWKCYLPEKSSGPVQDIFQTLSTGVNIDGDEDFDVTECIKRIQNNKNMP